MELFLHTPFMPSAFWWNNENTLLAFSYYFVADNEGGTGLLSVKKFYYISILMYQTSV
jgi:hypothetical protein